MKILLATGIYPPDVGGPATYTRALARALTSQGHIVTVVAYGDVSLDEEKFHIEFISRKQSLFSRYLKFMMAVWRHAKEVDVVYLQGPVSEGLPGTVGAFLAQKPTVMKVVGDYAWEIYSGDGGAQFLDEFLDSRHSGKIRLLEWIERFTAKRAKLVIVPSRYLRDVLLKWKMQDKKIAVVYNFVEPIPYFKHSETLRLKRGIPLGSRLILTAARAVPWKNTDFIINILPHLSKDIIFAIAGDGPSLKFWKEEAVKNNVQDRVIFLGKLNRAELAEWYRIADCFVLPSAYEGFPHVIGEAVSAGLPCFVSDKGGNPETRGVFGSIVTVLPYLNFESWIEALSQEWGDRYHIIGINEVAEGLESKMIAERKMSLPRKLFFDVTVESTMGKIKSVL